MGVALRRGRARRSHQCGFVANSRETAPTLWAPHLPLIHTKPQQLFELMEVFWIDAPDTLLQELEELEECGVRLGAISLEDLII